MDNLFLDAEETDLNKESHRKPHFQEAVREDQERIKETAFKKKQLTVVSPFWMERIKYKTHINQCSEILAPLNHG